LAEDMTTANKISIFRILLVPVFVIEVLYYAQEGNEIHRLAAIFCFAIASISDGVDGYIARRYNQRTELGAILDPLGDKLLLVAGIVLLSLNNAPHLPRLPLWLGVTVVSRDAIILIGMLVIKHTCDHVAVRPALIGKVATVLLMACILWALLKWRREGLVLLSLGAALCAVASIVIYVVAGVRQLSASPSSSPKP
jgi:CDP-diacylglycerol--glycerol-3-phosphate 3-phosphatidyltransferase